MLMQILPFGVYVTVWVDVGSWGTGLVLVQGGGLRGFCFGLGGFLWVQAPHLWAKAFVGSR